MRTLLRIWTGGLLAVVLLVAAACGLTPTVDPNLQAQESIAFHQAQAAQAGAAQTQAQAELVRAEGDAHVRKVQAETSARIQEMHEQVTEDLRRLTMERDNFVTTVNDHQAAMVNQTYLLQQQFHMMETIDYNAEAAAENSWFANIGVIMLAVAIVGLIGLVIVLFARVERRLTA